MAFTKDPYYRAREQSEKSVVPVFANKNNDVLYVL